MQLGSLQRPRNPMKGASEHFHFLSVLAGGPGLVPPALVFFRGLDPGCRAMFFVAAPWFSTSGGRLSEHFRDRNALGLRGAELPSWWDVLQLSYTRTRNHRQAVEAAS